MTRIAVSGHRGLSPYVESLIDEAIRAELSGYTGDNLVGLTCLADGADQIFAQAIIDRGGKLEVFIPASHYRDGLPEHVHRAYDGLLSQAVAIHQMTHTDSTSESHMDASVKMLENADLLFVVWDGLPARGFGGTADVVAHAREFGIPVTVIWPEGAKRD